MKRKIVMLFLTGALTLSFVTGCGSSSATSSSSVPAPTEATENADAEATENSPAEATESAPAEATANAPAEATESTPAEPSEDSAPEADSDADASSEEDIAAPVSETYKSDLGWSVSYYPDSISVNESDDPAEGVSFVYTGESAGACMVTATWTEKLPNEVLEELKAAEAQDTEVEIRGGMFPGTNDKWAYWFTPHYAESGSGAQEDYILGEYKGGTLSFQFLTHKSGDDAIDIPISDHLAMIVDSLHFEDFGPQTMYDGIAGKYVQSNKEEIEGETIETEHSLLLSEDHTGVLSIQDDINIRWDDKEIIAEDASFRYNYTLEGDKLTLDYDGEKEEFSRSK